MPEAAKGEVSPNNPCPFLRALVAQGSLPDGSASIGDVTAAVLAAARRGEGNPNLPSLAIRAIALIANGLGPVQMASNGFDGMRLNALRGGPLDKKGAGSAILDAEGKLNLAELDRLDEFAGDKTDMHGQVERGLDIGEITRMMDANFARAAGRRRAIDRNLMDGEWPILLRVMGKQGKNGRYLSIEEIRRLFTLSRLPERMTAPGP
jgi:hypothetical protein